MTHAQELLKEGEIRAEIRIIENLLQEGIAWSAIERITGVHETPFQALKKRLEEMNEPGEGGSMSYDAFRTDPKRLEELIEEATVDCYDEEEQHTGLLTMIGDEVVFPFEAKVMGDVVQVMAMKWPDHGYGLQLTCEKNGATYDIDVDSIEWMEPLPEGFEWIEAYLSWKRYL